MAAALCAWCKAPIPSRARRDSVFCGRRCRQTAFRFRQRGQLAKEDGTPKRLAYADPPYPGLARRYYAGEATYAGEVDHGRLIASLVDGFDGWALSTSARALRALRPLCPEGILVCPWVKPHPVPPATYGPHNAWEPLLVMPARRLRPGKRDWLQALPARSGGTLPGRKPIAFAAFLFEMLGALPCDTLADLYPGTGIIGHAWREAVAAAQGDASRGARGDASLLQAGNASR